MVTNWPPSSSALMRRPRIAISRFARAARTSPEVSSACSRAREAAVSAVSAAAKNAAASRLITMTKMASATFMAEQFSIKWRKNGGAAREAPQSARNSFCKKGA